MSQTAFFPDKFQFHLIENCRSTVYRVYSRDKDKPSYILKLLPLYSKDTPIICPPNYQLSFSHLEEVHFHDTYKHNNFVQLIAWGIIPIDRLDQLMRSHLAKKDKNSAFWDNRRIPSSSTFSLVHYLLFPCYQDGTLKDYQPKLNKDNFLLLFVQTLLAVKYLHDSGLIHSDIKPQNIMVDKLADGTEFARLGDFGGVVKLPPEATCVSARELTKFVFSLFFHSVIGSDLTPRKKSLMTPNTKYQYNQIFTHFGRHLMN